MKVKVGVSNRHIHLSIEDKNILFGDDYILKEKRRLSQDNNYACYETVNLINGDKNMFELVEKINKENNFDNQSKQFIKSFLLNKKYA